MNSRARELLPSVLLTLISIIQALALELLWSRLGEQSHLWTRHEILKRARQDPENSEFFDNPGPATIRDHAAATSMVSGLALLGVILQISGRQGWLALAALLLAIGGLAFQLEMTRRYWNLSMLGRRSRRE
jgi:hypothetical protein